VLKLFATPSATVNVACVDAIAFPVPPGPS
jgi:hypothetical protein